LLALDKFQRTLYSVTTMNLTKNDAGEVLHKLAVLADSPDLIEDYGLTQEQADALRDSVPYNGGEWTVVPEFINAVRGEMQDHARILRNIAYDARHGGEVGQALQIDKQAKRFEKIFK